METELNLIDLIHRGGVYKDIEGSTPEEVYANFCKTAKLPEDLSPEFVYNALCAREKVLSTAVGNGIALPHARAPIVKNENEQRVCVIYLKKPIEMNAPDDREVFVMFVLLSHNSQIHLKVLTELAALFRKVRFRKALEEKVDESQLVNLILELNEK